MILSLLELSVNTQNVFREMALAKAHNYTPPPIVEFLVIDGWDEPCFIHLSHAAVTVGLQWIKRTYPHQYLTARLLNEPMEINL